MTERAMTQRAVTQRAVTQRAVTQRAMTQRATAESENSVQAGVGGRVCPEFCVRDITDAKEASYAEQSQTD